jgi:peptide/nickel transport system substrate-binding protein
MKDVQRRVDEVRRERSEVENNLIDVYSSGAITRRDLIRRGTVLGMSLPMLGFLAAACGSSDSGSTSAAAPATSAAGATTAAPGSTGTADTGASSAATTETGPAPQQGGTVRVAQTTPSTAINPVLVQDAGGIGMLCQTGEYLCYSNPNLELEPVLAESWAPNTDGTVWTFKIRQGVTFSDGTPMTAKDVAAAFNRLADPKNKSNALSVFNGVMDAGGAKAVDDATVEFTLLAPNGNFPYYTSSDNYNAIIIPEKFTGDWEKTFIGTGPWMLDKYTVKQGASFVRNPKYWGTPTVADNSQFIFEADEAAMVVALQGGQVDLIVNFNISGPGRALVDNPQFTIIDLPSVAHRETHMRVDQDPFKDKRVRQAMALLVDRAALVAGLFDGRAKPGNDSPFASAFPSTDPSVPQRERDVEKAKALLAEAGVPDGFTVKWNVLRTAEVPDMAAILKENFREGGINTELVIQDSEAFYGDGQFGSSPWLDSTMGTVDYGHRGVPNVFLQAQLTSKGAWNAAHFKNPQYDGLVKDYVAALDVGAQQKVAGQIQQLLLDETPTIIPYFYDFLGASSSKLTGGRITAMSHVFVDKAGFTA